MISRIKQNYKICFPFFFLFMLILFVEVNINWFHNVCQPEEIRAEYLQDA